ncbi:hypothetical protein L226DRAFT_532132 [Lentinus tigrinus ALCF2SS1-7]|uniref:Uncharacterized protein n=1 Tax=Lentinus tigrinus ALCF2SS1-6 TaxID=1328759 RepID=A0A5C2S415_9APHY|nr:hypothetical protein L227DRAFT_577917 [Lentinus tigrinus ALCF2SS1-6]RPD78831.1 hypothetical protein L226DRAFT_532132 [Lentinus tigrinus ALCF2SS1-7]
MEPVVVEQTPAAAPPAVAVKASGPVPMSFPAILRTPGMSDRFAHLRVRTQSSAAPTAVSAKRNRRDEKEGKRWIRRKENARFIGNAHIVAPSRKDYSVPAPSSRTTFPEPLPHYLARNNPIPPAVPAAREPVSANAGRFSMSLKGMRRELRKSGPRTELLVKEVEEEIVDWLTAGGVILSPDSAAAFDLPRVPIGSSDAIMEVSRTPLQLVWSIADDAFTRYVVHCCARYHDVVSFSKDASGQRLTYLLRPNVTRPTHHAAPTLDTPPVTDLSEFSATDFDTESELVSDRDASDVEGPSPSGPGSRLTAIVEVGSDASAPASPAVGAVYVARAIPPISGFESDGWSVLGESDVDVDGDMSAPEPEGDLAGSVASLSLSDADADVERTPMVSGVRRRQGPDALRSRLLERQRRSASSPSPSPARRATHRARQRAEAAHVRSQLNGRQSFYDYLFA